MDLESYFLSFARLARRSAVFWGHAVTSGVSAFDGLSTSSSDDPGTVGRTERAVEPHEVGGVDYFVSSWLFEDRNLGRLAQRKYSERSARYTKHFMYDAGNIRLKRTPHATVPIPMLKPRSPSHSSPSRFGPL